MADETQQNIMHLLLAQSAYGTPSQQSATVGHTPDAHIARTSPPSSENLSLLLRILEEQRRLKEEERKNKELDLQLLTMWNAANATSGSSSTSE